MEGERKNKELHKVSHLVNVSIKGYWLIMTEGYFDDSIVLLYNISCF